MGSLLWGIEMWVDTPSMFCDAGHPEEDGSGLSAQLAWTLGPDGEPDGTIVSWHPVEITQWAVAQYAAMRRGQSELPGGGLLLVTHPGKPGSWSPQRELVWMPLADLFHLPSLGLSQITRLWDNRVFLQSGSSQGLTSRNPRASTLKKQLCSMLEAFT